MKPYHYAMFVAPAVIAAALLAGCAESTSNEPSAARRADNTIRDPWSYQSAPPTDITGGDIGHLDRDAMQRDVDHFLNP